ncbi:unknown [Clostridium sp. CAG:510]|nr:unknown [Clostridium sp. CAG:510]
MVGDDAGNTGSFGVALWNKFPEGAAPVDTVKVRIRNGAESGKLGLILIPDYKFVAEKILFGKVRPHGIVVYVPEGLEKLRRLRVPDGPGSIEAYLVFGFKSNVYIRLSGRTQNFHGESMCLGDVKQLLSAAVQVCPTSADDAVKSDFLKTGLHILKAASGIDIHQMSALSGFANGRNAAFRNGAVGFFCECSVNVKKDNFFHICIINLSGIKVKKYIKGFDKSRKISVFKTYFL